MSRSGRGWIVGVAVAAIVATAAGAVRVGSADDLELEIGQGRVTLIAVGVPLGDVLDEWARVGNTRFEGAGGIAAAPVSLHLERVTEREALRLLLRPAAGFLAAARAPHVSGGASIYDRVKIRAARRAPQPVPAGASRARRDTPLSPVQASPPALSEADQRERLQRLLRPRATVEAATGRPAEGPREGAVYAPTTPRPGMVVDAVLPARP